MAGENADEVRAESDARRLVEVMVACVAVAHKLARIVWAVWKHDTTLRELPAA